MKKKINIFIFFIIIFTIINTIITCTKKYKFDNIIWVITDGGGILDFSFNESAWNGASEYIVSIKDSKNFDKNIDNKWKHSKWRANYFETFSQTISDFKTAYTMANIMGAKTMILPGCNHNNTIGWAAGQINNIIYINGSGQKIHINMNKKKSFAKNILGLLYYTETSGFYAGIASAIYLNAHQTEYNSFKNLKGATYGGMDNPNVVSNYMWGFLIALDIFNIIIEGNKFLYPNLTQLKNQIFIMVHKLNHNINNLKKIIKAQNVLDSKESWFSQSFELGQGKDITNYLLNKTKQSNVIFPVAGPQIQDTINIIKYSKNKMNNTKVIGVDTKQSQIYNNKYIITSALKNIQLSIFESLNNIYSENCGYNNKIKTWNYNKFNSSKCWINTDQSSKDHINWIGIESTNLMPNHIINQIHNNDITTKKTDFDKIGEILSQLYNIGNSKYTKISSPIFYDTLKKTYNSQNAVKTYILKEIEKVL